MAFMTRATGIDSGEVRSREIKVPWDGKEIATWDVRGSEGRWAEGWICDKGGWVGSGPIEEGAWGGREVGRGGMRPRREWRHGSEQTGLEEEAWPVEGPSRLGNDVVPFSIEWLPDSSFLELLVDLTSLLDELRETYGGEEEKGLAWERGASTVGGTLVGVSDCSAWERAAYLEPRGLSGLPWEGLSQRESDVGGGGRRVRRATCI
ncbi:hypothetical protein K2173_028090 [Erythroxylum novogranatense]|uniref:Uncharacterized protein n=1 Tax=Erythroxylum novogranatense TaxID=1862640 RepID=A0AAV8U3I8_9ROSI|nr:hypothetical protein K2173_028090 [Erythroxylum novogranatense]